MARSSRWMSVAVCVAVFATAGAAALPAAAKPPASNVVDGRYIVLFEPGVRSVDEEVERQERARGFKARHRYRHALRGFAAKLAPGQVRALRRDPDVAGVVPDRRVNALGAVPLASGEPVPPPGVRRIGAATSTTTRQAADGAIAVVDTGIDLSHPDLNAAHGTNCVTPTALAEDDEGHGTHVAGTIGAKNDGAGVVGVAPGTKLYAVKVLDSNGSGTWSQIICGVDWIAANATTLGITVANMSLGGPGSNDRNCGLTDGDPLHQAICRATNAGVLHVVAAGNSGWDLGDNPPDTPAAFPEVLTVTAMGDTDGTGGASGGSPSCDSGQADDAYASFSNYASRAADSAHMIAAPGVCIQSTLPGGGYGVASGTSMASPHVAGAAALCLGEAGAPGPCAGKTPAQMIAQLRADAEAATTAELAHGFYGDPLRPNKWGDYFGYLARVDRDSVAPETSIASGPSGLTNATAADFSFAASEGGAKFECKLDAAAWEACASPKSYVSIADGSHTFAVRATDAAGNTDSSPATRTWTVDTQPPDTSITAAPPAQSNDPTPTFEFVSTDSSASFQCRTDSGVWASCTSPHTTASLADGAHSFSVRARDAAGNADGSPASASFTVDTAAPAVTLARPTAGSFTNDSTPALGGAAGTAVGDATTVSVSIYSGSEVSGEAVQVHAGVAVASGSWAIDASALADGPYTAQAKQSDAAGNSGASAAVSFEVDTQAADTSISSGPSGLTNDPTPTFTLASTESGGGFECRLDAGAWEACSSPHTTGTLADGDHEFAARAVDRAGNRDATAAARSLTVDATPPETTITSGPDGLTKSTTPTFEFAASESQATFECRVDSNPWTACSSPHRTETLSNGDHTFSVRATDRATNLEATPAARSFSIDPEQVATLPPSASSGSPSAVGETTATVTGVVNPSGQKTTYHFEHGTTSAYGAKTAARELPAEETDQEVSADLAGLASGTTYHYRVVATNASGTTFGADRTFTTSTAAPAEPTPAAGDEPASPAGEEPKPDAPTDSPAEQQPGADSPLVDEPPAVEPVASLPPLAEPRGRPTRKGFRFASFRLRLPASATATVRCKGKGCPLARKDVRAKPDADRLFKLAALRRRTLQPGARLGVVVKLPDAPRMRFAYRVARDGELLSCQSSSGRRCHPRRQASVGVRLRGRSTARGFRVSSLRLRLPAATRATIRCVGTGCPIRRRTLAAGDARKRVLRVFRRKTLGPGSRLQLAARRPLGRTQRVVYRISRGGNALRCSKRGKGWCRPRA